MMTKNPILDELHAVREKLLNDAGGTLDSLVDRLQAEEHQSNRPQYQAGRTIDCSRAADRVGPEANASWPPPAES